MTPQAEADRAAFEKWAAKANYNLARMVAPENEKDIGQYEMRGTQWAWEAWQAARTPSASGWASAIEAAKIESIIRDKLSVEYSAQQGLGQISIYGTVFGVPAAALAVITHIKQIGKCK